MFHREGYKLILITTIVIGISFIFIDKFATDEKINRGLSIFILFVYLFILQQFRNPNRTLQLDEGAILSPVDGTIKSIEKLEGSFRLTFYSSPFNFHVIRAPFDGLLYQHDNTVQIRNKEKPILNTTLETTPGKFGAQTILYNEKNTHIQQGEEIGFINFDGEVTMIVPGSSNLQVKINDRVKAGEHIIATI